MIYQWHEGLDEGFDKYACYEMVLDEIAATIKRLSLTPAYLNELHKLYVQEGYVGEDFYIKNPVAILRKNGVSATRVKKQHSGYRCKLNEVEVNLWRRAAETDREKTVYGDYVYHFVRGDGNGVTTYDPWGISKTAKVGEIRSKRIITISDLNAYGGIE